MKIEFHLEGPRTVAWFQTAINGYHEALVADREEADKRWLAAHPNVSPGQLETPTPTHPSRPKSPRRRAAARPGTNRPRPRWKSLPRSRPARKTGSPWKRSRKRKSSTSRGSRPGQGPHPRRREGRDADLRGQARHGCAGQERRDPAGRRCSSSIPEDPAARGPPSSAWRPPLLDGGYYKARGTGDQAQVPMGFAPLRSARLFTVENRTPSGFSGTCATQ